IEPHGLAVSFDGPGAVARGPITVPALLEESAEVRVQLLEAPESPERVVNAAEVALAHGDEIEDVPVLGDLLEQAAGIGEGARELAFLDEPANAKHLGLDPGACTEGLSGCHQAIIARNRWNGLQARPRRRRGQPAARRRGAPRTPGYFSENRYVIRRPAVRGGAMLSDFTNSR